MGQAAPGPSGRASAEATHGLKFKALATVDLGHGDSKSAGCCKVKVEVPQNCAQLLRNTQE